ncbi:MAG: ComF family protein [Lautropia sp.]|nr:ComF family protein [Lautropia sp.]
MSSAIWKEAFGRFLPRQCLLCEAPCRAEPLCPPCRAFLPGAARSRCRTCARPWQVTDCCATCRASAPAFDATVAAADYVAPLDKAITALKFSGQIGLASGLGGLLADAWAGALHGNPQGSSQGALQDDLPARPDCLVPIPLSAARLADRGFNQAHLIAAAMLKRLPRQPPPDLRPRIVLRPSILARHRDTLAQSLLPWRERQANLDHGFVASQDLQGLCIGVVDDVMTTGATLQAAALSLKQAGAQQVVNLVVARTA